MAHSPNPYQVLGIRPTASMEEVQRAFRRLAFQWHPDRHPRVPGGAARFHEIVNAYRAIRRTHHLSARAANAPANWPTWAIVPRQRQQSAMRWVTKARMRLVQTIARHAVILTLLFSAGSAMAITAIGMHEPMDAYPTATSKVDREELEVLRAREARFAPIDSSVTRDMSALRD